MEQEVTTVPQESQQAEVVDAIATAETTPQVESEKQQAEPRKLKVKHLHEEMEVTEEEAIPLIQKGMDYDRVKTQAEQAMEDRKLIESLAKDYGMDPATFKAELAKQAKQTRVQELTAKGVPEDIADEVLEARKIRAEQERQRETEAQATARRQKEAADFLREYPSVDPKTIPPNVWQEVEAGTPLLYAYAKHENATLRAQMAKQAAADAVLAKNAENAAAAPGGIGSSPTNSPDYISQERFMQMSDKEIAKNWDKVSASRKHWK